MTFNPSARKKSDPKRKEARERKKLLRRLHEAQMQCRVHNLEAELRSVREHYQKLIKQVLTVGIVIGIVIGILMGGIIFG